MRLNIKNKLIVNIGLICLVFFIVSCAASKIETTTDGKTLEDLMSEKSFMITSDWAQPLATSAFISVANSGLLPPGSSPGMISLIGNSNHLTIKGDTIFGYLPYFGERQMGGSYGSTNTGIQFEGIPKDYEIRKGKKESYEIRFDIADKERPSEIYQLYVQLFPSLTTNISVNSNQRFSIRYSGKVSTIQNE